MGGSKRKASKSTGNQKQRAGGGSSKRHNRGAAAQDVPLPTEAEIAGEGEAELSDEDLEVLEQFGSAAGFLAKLNTKTLDKSLHDKQQANAAKAVETAAAARKAKQQQQQQQQQEGSDDDDSDGGADSEELEDYERGPRRGADKGDEPREQLPVKTLDGQLVYQLDNNAKLKASQLHMRVAGVSIADDLDTEREREEEAAAKRRAEEEVLREQRAKQKLREKLLRESAIPPAPAFENAEARRAHMRELMASSAHKLLAAPEDHVGELKTLNTLANDADGYVGRLAMLSLLAVYKDLVPGYRIRLPTEEELQVKVTKEVQKLRDYEGALLRQYQAYLKSLVGAAGAAPGDKRKKPNGQPRRAAAPSVQHARVATKCMCALLVAAPHFNYASDLLQAIVPRMCSGDSSVRVLCCSAVSDVLRADVQGSIALEAVQLVSDLVRRRKCSVPPDVLRVLMVLDFSEVGRGGQPVSGVDDAGKDGGKGRKGKGRKGGKDDEVDRAFREADAGPDKQQLAIRQSQMLEALFEVLFRVIKMCTAAPGIANDGAAAEDAADPDASTAAALGASASPPAAGAVEETLTSTSGGGRMWWDAGVEPWSRAKLNKKFPLLGCALAGLARYAHLISVEYFEDLMDVFRQLLHSPVLPLAERLRCLQAAADILKGQGEALNVDRRDFYVQLYNLLLHELPMTHVVDDVTIGNHGAGDASDDDDDDDVEDASATAAIAGAAAEDVQTQSMLLASVANQMLVEPKITDTARLAAFTKRMASVALCARSGEALTLLALICRLLRRYQKLTAMLEWESGVPVGGRQWDAGCWDPSEAGGLAATLWEVNALTKHYHPHVAQAAKSLLALAPGAGAGAQVTGVLATSSTIVELAAAYDTSHGAYRPAPPAPKKRPAAQQQQLNSNRARRSAAELGPVLAEALGGGGAGSSRAKRKGAAAAAAAGEAVEAAAAVDERVAAAMACSVSPQQLQEVDASLSQHYRIHHLHQRSSELRRDEARLQHQLQLFRAHIQEQERAKTSQKQNPSTGTTSKAAAAGGRRGVTGTAAAPVTASTHAGLANDAREHAHSNGVGGGGHVQGRVNAGQKSTKNSSKLVRPA